MSFSIKKFFKSFGLAFVSCITVFSQVSATETVVLEKNQNTPKISVLMPVYNCEQYLRKSLDSVLNQTFKDIELICVNDGSKDNSLEILKEYSNIDSRLVVIDQENQGAALARQNAMKKATGEYIAFVDSDDIIDENAYEIAYDSIQKHDADILCFGWRNFSDQDGRVIRNDCKFDELKIYDDWYKAKTHRGSIYLLNKLYRRSLIEDNDVVFSPGR